MDYFVGLLKKRRDKLEDEAQALAIEEKVIE